MGILDIFSYCLFVEVQRRAPRKQDNKNKRIGLEGQSPTQEEGRMIREGLGPCGKQTAMNCTDSNRAGFELRSM